MKAGETEILLVKSSASLTSIDAKPMKSCSLGKYLRKTSGWNIAFLRMHCVILHTKLQHSNCNNQ